MIVEPPFFSIVIPTYNRGQMIVNTVQSILKQKFVSFELIIVDDGSTDNSSDLISSMSDKRLIYMWKENGERGAARNYGSKHAIGQYINFIDSDDLIYPNHLEVAREFILTNQNPEVFHLGYDVRGVDGELIRKCSSKMDINNKIISGNILSCNGVFIRKDVALSNQFSENRILSSIEDWELWLRLAFKFKFHSSPEVTSTVVQHESRSVMDIDVDRIKEKMDAFIAVLNDVNYFKLSSKASMGKTIASANTYASLHLAIANADRLDILSYLIRGLQHNPLEIFTRRFLVIIYLMLRIKK